MSPVLGLALVTTASTVMALAFALWGNRDHAPRWQLRALLMGALAAFAWFHVHAEAQDRQDTAACEEAVEELRALFRDDGLPAAERRAAELDLELRPFGGERTYTVHTGAGDRLGYVGAPPWNGMAVCPKY